MMSKLSPLKGDLAWTPSNFQGCETYVFHLLPQHILEIEDALKSFKGLGLDEDAVAPDNFVLRTLGGQLKQRAEMIHEKCGFFVLRGLDMMKYAVRDTIIIYLGVTSYVGNERGRQDRKGTMLSHVTDSKLWTVPQEKRHGIHSSKGLGFHTDMGCDILCLQVRECATEGGRTYLASAWSIFNEILAQSRGSEILDILFRPTWPIQVSGGKAGFILAPIMEFHDGKLLVSMDPSRLGPHPSAQDSAKKIPSLSQEQRDALDTLMQAAKRNEILVPLERGDILFVNNWGILHRRDAFTNSETASRHLVRLWLRSTDLGWSIPEDMMAPCTAAFGKIRKILTPLYPIFPTPHYKVPRYVAGSAAFVIDDSDEEDSS